MTPAGSFLPYGRQTIEDDDIAAVGAVLRSDYLTTGPMVDRFETAFAAHVDARFAVSCSSGTAGLHMAMLALGLGAGDAVIVPALTFLATANAVRFTGAEAVFADVSPETGLMSAEHLDAAIAEARRRGLTVKAVAPVHFAGQAVELAPFKAVLDRVDLGDVAIVEDACHAIGTRSREGARDHAVGDCHASAMAVFSLHPVKLIAMGEGGVVTTADPTLNDRLRLARNHGMTRNPHDFANRALAFDADGAANPWYYEMHEPGYNYRASAIHCALGLSQIGKLERFAARRTALVARYDKRLAPLASVVWPLGRREGCRPAWHLYVIRVDFAALGMTRAATMRALADKGIGTQVHYLPLHLQPYYAQRYGAYALPGAERLYREMLSIPLFPAMSDADADRVVDGIAAIVGDKAGRQS